MSNRASIFLSVTAILIEVATITWGIEPTFNYEECSTYDHISIASLIIQNVQKSLPSDLDQLTGSTETDGGSTACGDCPTGDDISALPRDCSDIYNMGDLTDGIREIWLQNSKRMPMTPLRVYCDMEPDGGGWTVIQRRGDFGNDVEFFNQDWNAYKVGFGDLEKEFWLGNENLFILTNRRTYELRVSLTDFENNFRYAKYRLFWIDDEEHGYRLIVTGYNGTAGDSLRIHSGNSFSAKDKDNDKSTENCAGKFLGGWWFKDCYNSFLNGPYREGEHRGSFSGVHWKGFKGKSYSLKKSIMRIRPTYFRRR